MNTLSYTFFAEKVLLILVISRKKLWLHGQTSLSLVTPRIGFSWLDFLWRWTSKILDLMLIRIRSTTWKRDRSWLNRNSWCNNCLFSLTLSLSTWHCEKRFIVHLSCKEGYIWTETFWPKGTQRLMASHSIAIGCNYVLWLSPEVSHKVWTVLVCRLGFLFALTQVTVQNEFWPLLQCNRKLKAESNTFLLFFYTRVHAVVVMTVSATMRLFQKEFQHARATDWAQCCIYFKPIRRNPKWAIFPFPKKSFLFFAGVSRFN